MVPAIRGWLVSLALAVMPSIAAGQGPITADGEVLPRYLTDAEREFLKRHPLTGPSPRAVTAPTGPVHCTAEYEPTDGLCISWEGGSGLTSILAQMGARITNEGNANLYVAVDSTTVRTNAQNALSAQGANMSRVSFVVRTMDSIWIRDYGPRYIYEGGCRAIVDHVYNRPRPNDDTFPIAFAQLKGHARYDLPLVHGGGNYHLSALRDSYCTRLIENENNGGGDQYNYTQQQIYGLWRNYQNVDTTFFEPFPTTVDATQHIDMWVQVYADRSVFVSDWPNNPGSVQDVICDNAAATFASRGYSVTRLPAFLVGGVHYTYTNMVICNNIVLLPSYTNATVSPSNATALAAVSGAMPGRQVFQINCQNIVSLAGVMHCIVMHVPVNRGGASPVAFLRNPRGGEAIAAGQPYAIEWLADDDVAVTSVDLLLSTDSGATYPTVIAGGIASTGTFSWTPPAIATSHARVKIVARDADGNTGSYESDSDFRIGLAACPGDIDGDGSIGLSDLTSLLSAFGSNRLEEAYLPAADLDQDNTIGLNDLTLMLSTYGTACP